MSFQVNEDFSKLPFNRMRTSSTSSHCPLDFTTSSLNSTNDFFNEFDFSPPKEQKFYELFPKKKDSSPNSNFTLRQSANQQDNQNYSLSNNVEINMTFFSKFSHMYNKPPPLAHHDIPKNYYPCCSTPHGYLNYSDNLSHNYSANSNSSFTSVSSDATFPYFNNSYNSQNISSTSFDDSTLDHAFSHLCFFDDDTSGFNKSPPPMSFGARTLKYSTNISRENKTSPSHQTHAPLALSSHSLHNASFSSTSSNNQYPGTTICTFCRKNNERPSVYLTHTVRGIVGNKKVVTCPILRSYVCPLCGVSGDNAHTLAYCPKTKRGNRQMESVTIALRNTRIQSKGTKKY